MARLLRIDPMVSVWNPPSPKLSYTGESRSLSAITGVGSTRCIHIEREDLGTARQAKCVSVSINNKLKEVLGITSIWLRDLMKVSPLGYTSIDGGQIREEAVDSDGNRPIRDETASPFNENVMLTIILIESFDYKYRSGSYLLLRIWQNNE